MCLTENIKYMYYTSSDLSMYLTVKLKNMVCKFGFVIVSDDKFNYILFKFRLANVSYGQITVYNIQVIQVRICQCFLMQNFKYILYKFGYVNIL